MQVHPDNEYTKQYENDNGKTEMWYVMDAADGASLIYGFEHPVTKELLRDVVGTETLDRHLYRTEIKRGDLYFVPVGTVHSIGAGTLIAEIQESSNVT